MNSNDSNLLEEVKDTLNAIKALKNGEPTVEPVKEAEEVTEEVVKDEAVEETKDAKEEVKAETAVEVVEEVTEEKIEEADATKEDQTPSKDEEATEEETEKSVEDVQTSEFAQASDVNTLLDAVKELTSYVTTLSESVEAIKSAKTSRKGIMPETEVKEEAENSEESKLKKQANYVFGK